MNEAEAKPLRIKAGGEMDLQDKIRRDYRAVRARIPTAGVQATLLHIGSNASGIATGSEALPEAILLLDVGSGKTAREHFRHTPPTPEELENAIQTVEDEVARARTVIARRSALYTVDDPVRRIARIAGVPEDGKSILTLDAVEQTFERLVAASLGRPGLRNPFPAEAEFAATLLILREFMHHLQFGSINVVAP